VNEEVAAGLVLDHHRLPPLCRELFADQARGDVDAGAGAERQDQLDRALRPALCMRGRAGQQQRGRDENSGAERLDDDGHGGFLDFYFCAR
jgi:hypothetical protein